MILNLVYQNISNIFLIFTPVQLQKKKKRKKEFSLSIMGEGKRRKPFFAGAKKKKN